MKFLGSYVLICKSLFYFCKFSGILPFVRVYNTPDQKEVNSELLPLVMGQQNS